MVNGVVNRKVSEVLVKEVLSLLVSSIRLLESVEKIWGRERENPWVEAIDCVQRACIQVVTARNLTQEQPDLWVVRHSVDRVEGVGRPGGVQAGPNRTAPVPAVWHVRPEGSRGDG